jgi:hypothetical protein
VAVLDSSDDKPAVATTRRAMMRRGKRSAARAIARSSRSRTPVRTIAWLTTKMLPRKTTTSLPNPANASAAGSRPVKTRASRRRTAVSSGAIHSVAKSATAAASRASRRRISPVMPRLPCATVSRA